MEKGDDSITVLKDLDRLDDMVTANGQPVKRASNMPKNTTQRLRSSNIPPDNYEQRAWQHDLALARQNV